MKSILYIDVSDTSDLQVKTTLWDATDVAGFLAGVDRFKERVDRERAAFVRRARRRLSRSDYWLDVTTPGKGWKFTLSMEVAGGKLVKVFWVHRRRYGDAFARFVFKDVRDYVERQGGSVEMPLVARVSPSGRYSLYGMA